MLRLYRAQLRGGIFQRLFPAHFAPWLVDALANHRRGDPVLVIGIAPGEAPLDARVPVIGLAFLPRHHAHQLLALHFGAERTADSAIGASRDYRALRLAHLLDGLFHERGRRAGLNAGAAGYAFGGKERVHRLARADLRCEAAPVHSQRQRALHFVAGPHASRTDDALVRREHEIGIGQVGRLAQVVFPLITIAHIAQADGGGHVLQLAIVVGAARQAIERVIGDIKLHHSPPQLLQARRLRMDDHACFRRCGAAGGRAPASFDLHKAKAARAIAFKAVRRAQLRDRTVRKRGRAHDRGSGGYGNVPSVNRQRDRFARRHFGRAVIGLRLIAHGASPLPPDLLAY